MRKVIAVIFILLLLVGLAYAGDAKKEDKDVLKDDSTTVDKTKETLKEIDKGIRVRDTSADIAKYDVLEEKDKITISKSDTIKDKKVEHTKTKLVVDEKTSRSIDVDKDGKFSVLRKVNGQVVEVRVVTLKELTTGIDTTFSEVIINGFTGYYRVSMALSLTANTNSTIPMYVPNADILTITFNGIIPESLAFSEV